MNQPQLYGRTNLVAKNIAKRTLDEFASKLNWKPNATVVDIGSGPGNVLVEEILPKIPNFKEAVGIDVSHEMVDFASKEYSKVPNLKFIYGDIQGDQSQFREYKNHFDCATSTFCLMLVPQQKKALQNICGLIKPGGDFFSILVVDTLIYEPLKLLAQREKWKKFLNPHFLSPYHGLANPRVRMSNYLSAAGFSNFEVALRESNDFYENENDFKEFSKSLAITNGTMPEEIKEEFYNEFFESIREDGYFRDGGCEVPVRTMTICATK